MKIRRLENLMHGRKLTREEKLDYQGVIALLSSKIPHSWVKVRRYNHGDGDRNVAEVILMLNEHFNVDGNDRNWFEGDYQVYDRKKLSKHYLDISRGHTKMGICKYTNSVLSWRESPLCKATLIWEERK
jgi:hypothetical protein